MPRWGITYAPRQLDTVALFGRRAPVVLEIGFGMGFTTAEIAAARPDTDFIGIEVHGPGVGSMFKLISEQGLTNVRGDSARRGGSAARHDCRCFRSPRACVLPPIPGRRSATSSAD
jgi:hypothetical protein